MDNNEHSFNVIGNNDEEIEEAALLALQSAFSQADKLPPKSCKVKRGYLKIKNPPGSARTWHARVTVIVER